MATRRLPALLVAAAVVLGGCGADLSDVPVPRKISGPTYEIDAVFDSALNLPSGAPVKLDGRVVGDVVSVEAVDYTARVRLRLTDETRLPAGTRAELRLSAPIGESFVALTPTDDEDGGALAPGDVIDVSSTATAPDTTDLLTSLSVAMTGGSYADMKIVVEELVVALDGNAPTVRHLIGELDTLVTSVNDHRDEIDTALDSLDRLAGLLAEDTDSLMTSVEELTPAIERLDARQDAAMKMLASVTRLGKASTSVIEGLRGTLAEQLVDAGAVLDEVLREQDQLKPLLTGIPAFGDSLDRATPGDYAAFDLTILGNIKIGEDLPLLNLDGDHQNGLPGSDTDPVTGLPGLIEGLVPDPAFVPDLLKDLTDPLTGGGAP
jgi:phospholipid/cholesterol/gamma-HCH transport system substrate-binding protein